MSLGYLNFDLPKPDWLNFGRTAEEEFENELSIDQTLAPLSGLVQLRSAYHYEHTGKIRWQSAVGVPRSLSVRYSRALPQPLQGTLVYGSALACRTALTLLYGRGIPALLDARIVWGRGDAILHAVRMPIPHTLQILFHRDRAVWGLPMPGAAVLRLPWKRSVLIPPWGRIVWDRADALMIPCALLFGSPWFVVFDDRIRWGAGQWPPHGWRNAIRPSYLPGKHWGRLNFVCLKPGDLNFGNACFGSQGLLVPVRRSYRVLNSASLIRLSDSADIPVSDMTIQLDWDSWCWRLSATLLGREAYDLVPTYPGKVRATINGFVWDFVVDEVTYARSFGRFAPALEGRSPACVYAAPYAAAKSYYETSIKTAQQLILQELFVGWDLDWATAIQDWTIDDGIWQYDHLTPIEAMLRVAKATGARLYADAVDDVLYVAPRWPQKPWAWSFVPDASLPSSYTLTEQLQPQLGTPFESILISGGANGGVAVVCTRTGTGGETVAPAVVDSLITDIEPAKARAIQEIADRWATRRYTLELPLQAAPAGAGLIVPGTTFDFTDGLDGWRGLVTGTAIRATRTAIAQSLEIVAT